MICPTCGSQVADGSAVCPVCSAQLSAPSPQPAPAAPVAPAAAPYGAGSYMPPAAPAKQSNNKAIIIAVAAVAVVALVIVGIFAIGSKPYEKPIKAMCTAIEEGDSDALFDTLPKEVNRILSLAGSLGMGDLTEEFASDELEELYGENLKVTYKIKDSEKLDDDDIEELEDGYAMMMISDMDIEEAYSLELDMTIKGDDDSDTEEIDDFVVVKIDGEWYIDFSSYENMAI